MKLTTVVMAHAVVKHEAEIELLSPEVYTEYTNYINSQGVEGLKALKSCREIVSNSQLRGE